ncbi:MAG: hypothetical protein GEU93_20495 [Propionibacteriales bacterium]|nr:hypothetical protein [Propionibacteriales bacterium]
MKRVGILLLALLLFGGVMGGMIPERGQATTVADLMRPIKVRITDGGLAIDTGLQREELIRGSIGGFRVINDSSKPRNFVVGLERSRVLEPGQRATFHVDLTVRGPLPYRVTVNREPGFSGVFRVF